MKLFMNLWIPCYLHLKEELKEGMNTHLLYTLSFFLSLTNFGITVTVCSHELYAKIFNCMYHWFCVHCIYTCCMCKIIKLSYTELQNMLITTHNYSHIPLAAQHLVFRSSTMHMHFSFVFPLLPSLQLSHCFSFQCTFFYYTWYYIDNTKTHVSYLKPGLTNCRENVINN